MSAGDPWANDAEPSKGWSCWPRLALLVLAPAAIATLTLTGCRTSPVVPGPTPPATGVQPQPPVTTVMPSAVQVRP